MKFGPIVLRLKICRELITVRAFINETVVYTDIPMIEPARRIN